jgi:hypothetical protein
MRTRITLIAGLSTVFLFLSIYGTPYVNGQSSTPNSSSGDNETSSTNSELKTENDPFVLKGSSNDPAQADDGSSANSNSDDDKSSANSNSDDSDKDGSDDDKSSKDDKESKDDRKFELPFP